MSDISFILDIALCGTKMLLLNIIPLKLISKLEFWLLAITQYIIDCTINKILSFTDKLAGKVKTRGGGKTLYYGGAIAPVSHKIRVSNVDRGFDRSCETTTGGSNRFPR